MFYLIRLVLPLHSSGWQTEPDYVGNANVYQLHKELQKLPPKPPVLVILVSFVIQGQCELNECEQLRRIRQCLTVHDPQEGGAWILHSAGTCPQAGTFSPC